MKKEKLISLISEQQPNTINDNLIEFEKSIRECESSQARHELFVRYCLAPDGYKDKHGEVFASVVGIEKSDEINYVNISVITPSMVYIDNRYFVSGNDDEDYLWWKEYRPYYYEFTAILTDEELNQLNSQISQLKTTSEYDDNNGWSFWFKATLKEKSENELNDYKGILYFGGSPSYSDEVVITSLEPIFAKFNKILNLTYKIKISPNEHACTNYLNNFFGNASHYKAEIYNVGQANCIYIEDENSNQHFFFDLGRPNHGYYDRNAGKYIKNPDLLPNTDVMSNLIHIPHLQRDCIIISHWHLDHFAAYKDLDDYGISSVWILPRIVSKYDIKSANRLLNYLVTNNTEVYYLNSTGKIYDNGVIQLLSSTSAKNDNPNTRSLILRINDTVFSADCLYEFWPDDLKNNLCNVCRLVVPHHCSKLSTNQYGKAQEKAIFSSFSKTPMKEAYISKGYNTYHHPNTDHLAELGLAAFNIYFTENALLNYEVTI